MAGTTIAFLAAGSFAFAQSERCTSDTLTIDGAPISATFCAAPATDGRVMVTETFARGTQRFSRPLAIDIVSGASVTRAVDDVPLTELGSNKQVHLTIAYRAGAVTLEHALLLPGAVVLK